MNVYFKKPIRQILIQFRIFSKKLFIVYRYRNKCEFTVGIDEETNLPTVGFRIGSYVNGTTGVGPINDLIHIPQAMKTAVGVSPQNCN